MNERRVVVTGLGLVSALGNDINHFWNRILNGESAGCPISKFDTENFSTKIAAEIKDFDVTAVMNPKEARRTDLFTQYAMCASHNALIDAGFPAEPLDDDRFGAIIGSGIGGIKTFEDQMKTYIAKGPKKVSPFFIAMMIPDMASGRVAISYGLKGPNFATTSACASSGNAIGMGYHHIKHGYADRMLVGGAEAPIVEISIAGFCSNRAMTQRNDEPTKASRPFDTDRDGFLMGEGSGILILEELESAKKRGAKIYAEIASYASTDDAFHITAPPEDGDGAYRAMRDAIEFSGARVEDVNYINTHGTSTPVGDSAELLAIKKLFGDHVKNLKVNSTKAMIGHLLGAASAVESIVSILSIMHNKVHPSINIDNPDPTAEGIDLVLDKAIDFEVNYVLNNSFGFGGHNSSILYKRFDG